MQKSRLSTDPGRYKRRDPDFTRFGTWFEKTSWLIITHIHAHSMPHFDLFFKTKDLRRRLEPHLGIIPPFFEFTVRTGTPEVRYFDPSDPMWKGFPFPVPDGTVYVFDDDIPARALGGGMQNRASVRVTRGDQDDEALVLRIWHEILHAIGQPADDMAKLANEWQSTSERLIWAAWQSLSRPPDVPFWHRKFYAWLTERAASEVRE